MGFIGELIGILQDKISQIMLGKEIAKTYQEDHFGRKWFAGDLEEALRVGHEVMDLFKVQVDLPTTPSFVEEAACREEV